MKKVLAILGALLLVALGFLMPRIAAAVQDRSLEGDVWEKENAAVSLTLAQEIVELPELDVLQSIELFKNHVAEVELEKGRNTSEQDAIIIAESLANCVGSATFYTYIGRVGDFVEVSPWLLTDENGLSGIFWRFSWKESTEEGIWYSPYETIWIDDQNSIIVGCCLRISPQPIMQLCQVICERFFPPYISTNMFNAEGAPLIMAHGDDIIDVPVKYISDYFCLNMPANVTDALAEEQAASREMLVEAMTDLIAGTEE